MSSVVPLRRGWKSHRQTDAGESKCPRGGPLLNVMGSEDDRLRPSLAQEDRRGQVDRLQRPDNGRHRLGGSIQDAPSHWNEPDDAFDAVQLLMRITDPPIVEEPREPKYRASQVRI